MAPVARLQGQGSVSLCYRGGVIALAIEHATAQGVPSALLASSASIGVGLLPGPGRRPGCGSTAGRSLMRASM